MTSTPAAPMTVWQLQPLVAQVPGFDTLKVGILVEDLVRNIKEGEIFVGRYTNEMKINIVAQNDPPHDDVHFYTLITIMTEQKLLIARPRQSYMDHNGISQYSFIQNVFKSFFAPLEKSARVICRIFLPSQDGVRAIGYNYLDYWRGGFTDYLRSFSDHTTFHFEEAPYYAHSWTGWAGKPDDSTKIVIQDGGTASEDPDLNFTFSNDLASGFPVASISPFPAQGHSRRVMIEGFSFSTHGPVAAEVQASLQSRS